MATQTEEDFKVCGLCSQLVDESVVINDTLRSFLVEFLAVIPVVVPGKTCLECYKTAIECKRFREACLKSFAKLEKKSIYSNMILGKNGPEPKKQAGPKSKNKNQNTKSPASGGDDMKKKRILESLGLDLDNIDSIEREDRTGRSSRSRGASTTATPTAEATTSRRSTSNSTPLPSVTPTKTPKSNKKGAKKTAGKVENADGTKNCTVFIKKVERARAERYLKEQGVAKSKNDIGSPPSVPKSGPGRKRKSSIETPLPAALPLPVPPAKKLRKGYTYELQPVVPINGEDQPLVPASSAGKKGPKNQKNAESRSSFGRERKNVKKTGYVYDENDVIIDEETNNDTTGNDKTPNNSKNNKTPAKNSSNQKANKKSAANENKNKKNSPTKNSAKPAAAEPIVEEIEDDDDDMEEVFPTIGPYQCEICQVITDTKAEFVAHIKAKHRGIVDEDVLRSLESDIRKAKKKEKVAAKPVKTETEVKTTTPNKTTPTAAKNTKPQPASAKKTTPKQAAAAKSPAKTQPAAKPTPASKKKPGPASKKAPPPPKAEQEQRQYLCEFCDTLLPPSRSSNSEISRHKNSKACRDAKQKKLQEQEARNAEDPLADDDDAVYAAEIAGTGNHRGDEAPVVIDNAEEDEEEFSSIMETISADQNIKNFVQQNGTITSDDNGGQNNSNGSYVQNNTTSNAVPQYRPPSYFEKPVTNVEWPW